MDSNDLAWIKKHLVDLKRSDWDKKNSDPTAGKFVFRNKVYFKSTDYNDEAVRPEYVYKFVGYSNGNETDGVKRYMWRFGAEPVVASDGDIWPETLVPNAEGHYVVMDAMLVRIPLDKYIGIRLEERSKNNDGYKISQKQFSAETKAAGIDISVDLKD